MAFALVAVAGLTAGLTVNVFAIGGLAGVLFIFSLLACAKSGIAAASVTAAELVILMQIAYFIGILARGMRSAGPVKSQDATRGGKV